MSNKLIDRIAFNETRLDQNITNSIIHINDYDFITKDRPEELGAEFAPTCAVLTTK